MGNSDDLDVEALLANPELRELLDAFHTARSNHTTQPASAAEIDASIAIVEALIADATKADPEHGAERALAAIVQNRITCSTEQTALRAGLTEIIGDLATIQLEDGPDAAEAFGALLQWAADHDIDYTLLMNTVFTHENEARIRAAR